ncbi:MAG TPA: YidB family protein [Azospira sp.]|nr:YidB family protein [Azospira sp.]
MGLLDQARNALGGGSGQPGDTGQALLGAVMQLINDPQSGGLQGLIQSFQSAGLGEIVKSWLSPGANLPISAEQVRSALGNERIDRFSGQLGVSTEQASGQLAEYLPQIIDKLTPDGSVPAGGTLMAQGIDLLKGKLFR